ncbi:MAG TPA: LemA family protein [Longimicrobiales bacterium]|jgi:LemA protein|nr:LemA family protein [Longimicrobiales bacterium]
MWYLLIVVVIVVLAVGMYNSLVRLRLQVDGAWADIDVQLKRRYDLIPNLVETVKGYASHEKGTLEAVVQARSAAMSAQGPAAKAEAEGALAGALKSLFALSEAYPQLQAAGGFRDLQGALSEIEEQVAQARRYYNAVVRDFNTKTETFPSVFVARAFGFTKREFFEVAEGEKAVPKVKFD